MRRARIASLSRRTTDIIIEIGKNLEMLAKIGVERCQQVVEEALSENHDPDVERDRVGLERDRAAQAEKPARVLDDDLPPPERPLQGRPAERLEEQVAGIEKKISAVGAVDGTCLDKPEVGDEDAVTRDVLDRPVRLLRVGCSSSIIGGALAVRLADKDIDRVAIKRCIELVLQR